MLIVLLAEDLYLKYRVFFYTRTKMSRVMGAHLGNKLLHDKEHWEIHEGGSFTVSTLDEDMGDGDKINIGFKTPASKSIHMIANFMSKTASHMTIYEGPSWSGTQGSGLAIPIMNRNRQSSNISTLLTNLFEAGFAASGAVNSDLTGLGGGTILKQKFVFAANPVANPSPIRGQHEWLLSGGTQYAIQVESDAATSAAELELNWYEE